DANGVITGFAQAWVPWNRIGTLMDTPNLAGAYEAGTRWFFGDEDWGDYRLEVELGWNGTADGADWPGFLVHFRVQEDRIGGPGHPGDYLYITQTNIAMQRYNGDWVAGGSIADMSVTPLHLTLEVHGNMTRVFQGTDNVITSATVFNSGTPRPHGRMGLFLDGVHGEVNNLQLNRIRLNDDPPEPPPPRDPMNQQAVENAGVWPIARPVAGQFPTGLYLYRFQPGTSQRNLTGGAVNNFHQTITWYPPVPHTFEANTQYTATLHLASEAGNRTFAHFPLSVATSLAGLPTDGVDSITARHEGHDLFIDIAFVPTGNMAAATRIMHEDFSMDNADERNVHGLGNYFRRGPQDNNRHGLSTWRDVAGTGDPLSFVRESADEGIGNELVIGFVREDTHAPSGASQAFRDNWITAGVATTRDRNNNNLGTNRGNTAAFETTYGFIESSIQFDVMRGAWGAFWTFGFMVDFFYDQPGQQGAAGTEIDVVETFHAWRGPNDGGPNTFNNAIHFNGYGMHHSGGSQNHNSTTLASIFDGAQVNVYDGEFHNFAVEWTPSYYIFFLNGREIARFGEEGRLGNNRIMQNPSYLKFSIEASDWAGGIWQDGAHVPIVEDETGEFRVDFVSVWNGPRPNIITYAANGGQGNMDESHVIRGDAHQVAPNAFTRAGYVFTGWNTCPDGTGTAHAPGSALQTSTHIVDVTLYAQWEVPAATIPVTGITVAPQTLELAVDGEATLTATVTPAGATNPAVTWASSNEAVATVINGVITAVAPGTTIITVTTVDGGFYATVAVTVTAPAAPPCCAYYPDCDCDETPTPPNTTALAALVAEALALEASDYTPSSWAPLAAALTAAQQAIANPDATQDEVDAAYDALLAAMDALELVTEPGPGPLPTPPPLPPPPAPPAA
ncbi:MAG: family 16 glycosylhydrolase, partial [Defluviitaleaceae bacterium]|nr:family 16 glycosylhydrolase [Defluviitaleaceae bacterium]